MAKKQKEFVAFGQMTKKAKFLHFLKIFGISFGAVLGLVAGVILYVFATGGFNPPYVPLTSFNFSQDEYVIDTNNQIMLDEEGNQVKNEDGDLMFEQITDTEGNPVYSYVMIVPNEGCTELDAVVQLKDWTDTEPCIQFVEDDNVVAIREDGEGPEDICYKYNVKINSPIYIKTKTINQNGTFRLLNGWIRLLATNVVDGKPGMITTSTWVYVDTSVEQLEISLRNADSFESEVIAVGQENVDFYDVYPNSNINIQNSILPLQSMASPSSNVPSSKGTTSFRDSKTVVYQSSDPDIATVDATGRVSIVPHKEGQTFSIYAYIISKFSDINNMPNITDYADDTTNAYKKAVNRICVFSNVLHFKINEIAVSELTTLKDGANRVSYNYNVFETGRITFNNDSTKTVAKNNYFVDLVLTDSADDSFKQELLSNIKLYVAIEGDLLSESEISSINEGSYLISQITDLPVNNHHIADASRYISIDEKTHQYVINEYSQNNFYLIFYYGSIEGSVKYDYIPFTISKVSVQGISTRGNSINMTYEEEGGDNVSETYALNSNNFATINPTTATYTTLLYFVCNAENGTKIVEVDDSISLNINSKNYYLVKFENNGRRDYGTIHPVSYGRVTLYAVVLRTLPTTVIYDSETGAPISPINFTPLTIAGQDVKLLKNTSGELDFEYYSDPITLIISKDAIFNGIQQYTKTQENVYNKSDKVNFVSDPTKPDYPSDKTDSDLYAEINQGGEFAVQVNYTGELIDVEGTKLQVVHVQGADTTVASVSKVNNTIVGEYYFSILANKVGTTQFQIIYNGSKGEQSVGTIGIKVLSTELVEMDIDASNKTINLNFTVDGEGKATGFDWDYLEMNLGFKSTETEATGFELRTYIIPEDFDTSKVALYQNKQFDEEISGIAEKYNSIQKLVQWLTITDDYIRISNDFTTVSAGTRQKNTIYVTANGTKYAFAYDFVSSGSVLLFASSTSTTICSNPVLVNIVLPTVTVQYGDGNVGENSARVIAFGDIQTGGLLSLDNNITRAKSINLYLDGVDKIRFYANGTVNISDLVHFKFTKQTVDPLNLSLFKSQTSGATIFGSSLTIYETSREISEKIIAYTDFGYTNAEFFTYTFVPDYKVVQSSSMQYLSPTYIDLFQDGNTMIVDSQYDGTLKNTNKLYLPVGYAASMQTLSAKFSSNLLSKFYYTDEGASTPYYHIYCNLNYVEQSQSELSADDVDYYVTEVDNTKLIKLSFKRESTPVSIRFVALGGKALNARITVLPGIANSFSSNNVVSASGMDSTTPVNLSDKLGFVQLTDYQKTNDTQIVAGKTYYIYDSNEKAYIIVSTPNADYLENYYEQIDMFNVEINSLDIVVTTGSDENITFFERNGGTTVESFTPYQTLTYSTSISYNHTTDVTLVAGKTYYIINSNSQYEAVANPQIEDIEHYYEVVNHYFVKTEDISSITVGKTYYQKNNDGSFSVVENPQALEVESYYELVYSSEVYYGLVEAYYVAIDSAEVAEKYLSKYYEMVVKYRKATGSFDASQRYFTYDMTTNTYNLVLSPSADELTNYYVEYSDYSLATYFDRSKTYYYKYNYAILPSGSDISDAYQKFSLRIVKESGEFKIYADDNIKDLDSSMLFTFKLTVTITNIQNNCSFRYTGYSYTFKIEGMDA